MYSTRSNCKAAFSQSVIWTIQASSVWSMKDDGPHWINKINDSVHSYIEGYHSVIEMTLCQGKNIPQALTNNIEHQDKKSGNIDCSSPHYSKGDQVQIFVKNKRVIFAKVLFASQQSCSPLLMCVSLKRNTFTHQWIIMTSLQ